MSQCHCTHNAFVVQKVPDYEVQHPLTSTLPSSSSKPKKNTQHYELIFAHNNHELFVVQMANY